MAYWLLKTEPDCYSWEDLVRDKATVWDGVANALALKHLRTMRPGDLALVYHTGDQRAAVGVAEVRSGAYPDPKLDDEKAAVVDLKPKAALPRPVTLSQIKADPAFADWVFLKIGRLSIVPVPDNLWARLMELAGEGESKGAATAARAAPERKPAKSGVQRKRKSVQ